MERLAHAIGAPLEPSPFDARFGSGWLAPDAPGAGDALEVGLLAPTTWMNRSGRAVAAILAAHPELDPRSDLLVVLDDLDLPFGRLRLRARGGAGGHNGLADVLERLDSRDVPRLRFGVGRPPEGVDPVDHVLAAFSDEEERALPGLVSAAGDAVSAALLEGVDKAMGRVNRLTSADEEPGPTDGARARPAHRGDRGVKGEPGDTSGTAG